MVLDYSGRACKIAERIFGDVRQIHHHQPDLGGQEYWTFKCEFGEPMIVHPWRLDEWKRDILCAFSHPYINRTTHPVDDKDEKKGYFFTYHVFHAFSRERWCIAEQILGIEGNGPLASEKERLISHRMFKNIWYATPDRRKRIRKFRKYGSFEMLFPEPGSPSERENHVRQDDKDGGGSEARRGGEVVDENHGWPGLRSLSGRLFRRS